jgi:hypothetical protein
MRRPGLADSRGDVLELGVIAWLGQDSWWGRPGSGRPRCGSLRPRAADLGCRVLSSRPSEVETRYSFAGLTDVVADIVDEVSAALPPQG